jgi:hypothetical protein
MAGSGGLAGVNVPDDCADGTKRRKDENEAFGDSAPRAFDCALRCLAASVSGISSMNSPTRFTCFLTFPILAADNARHVTKKPKTRSKHDDVCITLGNALPAAAELHKATAGIAMLHRSDTTWGGQMVSQLLAA